MTKAILLGLFSFLFGSQPGSMLALCGKLIHKQTLFRFYFSLLNKISFFCTQFFNSAFTQFKLHLRASNTQGLTPIFLKTYKPILMFYVEAKPALNLAR